MYYVYEWYNVDTNEILYVGKGSGKRYKVRYGRNQLLKSAFEKCRCESRIVKEFDNEKDAFAYEYERINELKQIGMCSCNIHCGGAGGSGEYWTDELRKEYSEHNVMKDPIQRKRMSTNNPMHNPDVVNRVAKQKSRHVIIGDHEYQSVKEACKAQNKTSGAIRRWCQKGINNTGELCRYADEEQVIFTDKRYNKGSCKAVIFNNKIYESVVDFAKELKIGYSTAFAWLERGFNPSGETCRSIDDNRNLSFENKYIKRNKARAKPVIINGIFYKSVYDASCKLQIPKSTLYSYLQKRKYNPNVICEYGNQQPSQENVA